MRSYRKGWRKRDKRGRYNSRVTIIVIIILTADSSNSSSSSDDDASWVSSSNTTPTKSSYTVPDGAQEPNGDNLEELTEKFLSFPDNSERLFDEPGIDDEDTASDKSGHHLDQPAVVRQEEERQEIVQGGTESRGTGHNFAISNSEHTGVPQDDVRVDTRLVHRPLHYLNSVVTILDPPKPSTFTAPGRRSAAQNSRLLRLPLEIQQLIYGKLDVTSLLRFALTSQAAQCMVETFPAWRHLSDHSLDMLAVMSQMKLLRRHTVARLYRTLCSARCVGCPPLAYGAYVFLPTADRCCWVCLSYHPMFRVISLRKAAKFFGISVRLIKRELHAFHSIPGTYDEGWQVSLAPHKLVCAREAAELGLRVHGSVDGLRAAADVSSWNESPLYKREATYLQSAAGTVLGNVDPWSWAPPTSHSSWPRPIEESAVFDLNFGKAVMLVSRLRPGAGIEQVLWCKGCDLVLEDYKHQLTSDEYISAKIEEENNKRGIRRDIGHVSLRDIVRGLTKQARTPDELYQHAKFCYGAQRILQEARSLTMLSICDSSDHRSRNLLDVSTIVDSGGSTHIVNDFGLLEKSSLTEANEDDYIISGGHRNKVLFRGRRIMKGILKGHSDSQMQDLVLENVAYVPGFGANILSPAILKRDSGYWVCGYDNTLRAGPYDNSRVLLKLAEISNVTVAEYKEDPEYIISLVGRTSSTDPELRTSSVFNGHNRNDERPETEATILMSESDWSRNDKDCRAQQNLDIKDGRSPASPQTWEDAERSPRATISQEIDREQSHLGRESINGGFSESEHTGFVPDETKKILPVSVFARDLNSINTAALDESKLTDPDTTLDHQLSIPQDSPLRPLQPESQSRVEFIPDFNKIICHLPASHQVPKSVSPLSFNRQGGQRKG